MKEELSIDIIGLAGACSYALDCNRSRVGKYQKQTWKKSGLYKYMHGWILENSGWWITRFSHVSLSKGSTRSGGILKQATMSRKPSGHFVVIWYEAARVLIIKL